jgi:hypothetical protein
VCLAGHAPRACSCSRRYGLEGAVDACAPRATGGAALQSGRSVVARHQRLRRSPRSRGVFAPGAEKRISPVAGPADLHGDSLESDHRD